MVVPESLKIDRANSDNTYYKQVIHHIFQTDSFEVFFQSFETKT